MSFGFSARRVSYPSPRRAMTPGRWFSMSTSDPAASWRQISCPSSLRRSRVTLFLLRFRLQKVAEYIFPPPQPRNGSPRSRSSTLITSAPRSAMSMDANGPVT